jgi:ABC-type phosphate transport system substrate-binding protein
MRHASGNTRMKFIAGAVLLCLASAGAHAATVVAGGATLPAVGYAGFGTSSRLMTPSATSYLGVYSAAHSSVSISYCQTGSGAGKNVLANFNGNNVAIACVVPSPSTNPVGFGGTGLTQPHFVGSDSPLSTGDYNNYQNGRTDTGHQPVQVPAVSGAISIAYNQPNITALKLNEDQLCRIFSGDIKTWNDSRLTSAITLKSGTTVPTTGINVVYRADGSGTSFSLSNHLTAKCGTASVVDPTGANGFHANGAAPNFKTDQSFATAAAAYIANYSSSTAASGNQGVVDAVVGTTGTIGYAEAANSVNSGAQIASLKNDVDSSQTSPATYGGTKLPVTTTDDMVIGATLGAGGRALLTGLPSTPVVAGCVKVVDPAKYATPAAGYPIVAVSYLLGNRTGNGTQLANVKGILLGVYDATPTTGLQAKTKTIGTNTGLSFLSVSPAISSLDTCVVN